MASLAALNRERAKEEARSPVRRLRPGLSHLRFGIAKEEAEQLEADLGETTVAKGVKPSLPVGDTEQTAFEIDALISSRGFADANAIAAQCKQGQKIRPAVIAVLASLHRMGLISTSDGKSFAWRRAD